jgi:double-stranded uracil-DNA glycosylase
VKCQPEAALEAQSESVRRPRSVMPNVLRPGFAVVLGGGTPVGEHSAKEGADYALPGNRFGRTLHAVGLTERLMRRPNSAWRPATVSDLPISGTTQSGRDHAIQDYDGAGLERKIRCFAPGAVAFPSRARAAKRAGMPRTRLNCGLRRADPDFPPVFRLMSPFCAARGRLSISPWRELAHWLAERRRG